MNHNVNKNINNILFNDKINNENSEIANNNISISDIKIKVI